MRSINMLQLKKAKHDRLKPALRTRTRRFFLAFRAATIRAIETPTLAFIPEILYTEIIKAVIQNYLLCLLFPPYFFLCAKQFRQKSLNWLMAKH